MKLALVNITPRGQEPPIGLAYLASYIREYSGMRDIVIVDRENPVKIIEKEKPDIVGMGSYSYNFHYANALAKDIKDKMNVPVIVGGPHISALPHHIAKSNFDVGVIGEGEQTMLELMELHEKCGSLNQDKIKEIKGIVYKNNGSAKITAQQPLIEPLDRIPYPARDLLDMEFYHTLRKGTFDRLGIYSQLLTSRGCPYKCTFCSPTNFWRKPRFHSAEYVVNEIKLLKEKYKADGVLVWDDLFIADKNRLREIVRLLKSEGLSDKMEFSVFARANLMNDEMCMLLKDMNVTSIDFGLESGSEKTLRYLKKGTVTVGQNRNALKICKQYGMKTLGSFIIGSPDETEEDLRQTLELVKDKNLDEAYVLKLMPLPGTEVWDYAKKEGIVTDDPDFDFSKVRTYVGFVKTDMQVAKNMDKATLDKWLQVFQNAMDEKNRRVSSLIEFRNIRHVLSYRFLRKVIKNRGEALMYLKKIIAK